MGEWRTHMIRARLLPLLLGAACLGAGMHATRATLTPRCVTADPAAARPSLHCIELFPTPDLQGVTGTIELAPVRSPFGVAVDVDGHQRYDLIAEIAGLPDPRTLGDYTTYIAWAYTLTLDRPLRLGEVRNGRIPLAEVSYDQFRVLVSAERGADVRERTGRLVLRGTSPSTRLLAHRDLLQSVPPGAMTAGTAITSGTTAGDTPGATAGNSAGAAMSHATTHAHGSSGDWPMPPMPPGMSAMQGMDTHRPAVAPFRPGAGIDPAMIAAARPREMLALADGDTLDLDARLVRRTIGGASFIMYGFNGQYPGPLIRVAQGATIVVRFRNRIELPSAVHWHGVRLENRSDGAVGVTQEPVLPGGAYLYRVHFPDAGIYWYHPHQREDIQQDLGLAGNILVESPRADYYGPANREEVLLLDDLLVGEAGPIPHGAESPTHALMGRFGNVMLVNGEPRYRLSVRRGEVVRFHLTNAASARFLNLSFGGAPMKVVASDVGRFEREAWVHSVVLAPAERYVVDVRFPQAGRVAITNRVRALDHMVGTFSQEVDTLGLVQVDAAPATPDHAASFATLRGHAEVVEEIARLRPHFTRPPDRELVLALRTRRLPDAIAQMLNGVNVPVDWNDGMPMMNWITTGNEIEWLLREPASGRENMDVAWRFRQHDLVRLRLVNDPSSAHAMAHPIHLHGQRFLVLSRNGVPGDNLVWKDTAIIPAGETVELLVEMSNPGRWMLHCHIAEHLSAGMMMVFEVEKP